MQREKGFVVVFIPIIIAALLAIMLFLAVIAKASELCDGNLAKAAEKIEKGVPGGANLVTTICEAVDKVDQSFKNAISKSGVLQNIGPTTSTLTEEECLEKTNAPACYKGSGAFRAISQDEIDRLDLVPIPSYMAMNEGMHITRPVMEILVTAYENCGGCFRVSSAYRSIAHQAAVWTNQGCGAVKINHPPECGPSCKGATTPVAIPGCSSHQSGHAVDINGVGSTICSNSQKRCDLKIVDALTSIEHPEVKKSLKHFRGCTKRGSNYETGTDCVHFSFTGG